jgi:hypothetical protein
MTVAERAMHSTPPTGVAGAPTQVEEAAARRTLRDQIARLEGELGELTLSAWPRVTPELQAQPPGAGAAGAAFLSLAHLEHARDALAARAAAARRALDERGRREESLRRTREEMLLDPQAHRFTVVTNADVGEAGCRNWHARPRFGLLGMLAGWWRVVVSGGCPLARGAPAPLITSQHARGTLGW